MKITLVDDERIRLAGVAGPLTVEAESPEQSYSPFHMLASGLATCIYSVLQSWAHNADLASDDLSIDVRWSFAENPYRVGRYEVELTWPSLPEPRRGAAERAAHLCTVHQTLLNPPDIQTRLTA